MTHKRLTGLLATVCCYAATAVARQPTDSAPPPATANAAQAGDTGTEGSSIRHERLDWHIPDPVRGRELAQQRRQAATDAGDTGRIAYIDRLVGHLGTYDRPEKMRLTLEEVVQRTLANSYMIETVRYNPAVDATRVVEAEAAFDAVWFADVMNTKVDQPTANQLVSAGADFFSMNAGLRKLLSSGALVTGQYRLQRTKQSFAFQTLNPAYASSLERDICS